MPNFHVTGVDPSSGERVDLWISGGHFVEGPVREAVELTGYVLPGFVDAHCHVGYSQAGAVSLADAEAQMRTNLSAGVLAIRDCGSPTDTSSLVDRDDLPLLIRAGRHIARPKRYIRDLGVDVEPEQLVDEVRRQLAFGSGQWIKIVGDWIDRDDGDLAPLWPTDVVTEAIAVAHQAGARVTSHVFGEAALEQLVGAGIDCIEHGTGLGADTIDAMAARGVHLVPTLINIENFPAFADAATRFPRYAAHIRELYARRHTTFTAAAEAGIVLHAGTDAGGYLPHGLILDEVDALAGLGLDRRRLLALTTHEARAWLGVPGWEIGAHADLLVFAEDPAHDLSELRRPLAVLRAGHVRGGVHHHHPHDRSLPTL